MSVPKSLHSLLIANSLPSAEVSLISPLAGQHKGSRKYENSVPMCTLSFI